MGEYEDLPYVVIERRSGGASAFLWGALLGAGVALLLAPRSGAETQEEIRQGARRLRTAAEDRVNDAVTRTRTQIQDRVDTVRDTLETRGQQARQAVDVGRQAARDARGELRRRISEVKDSYAAVADAVRNPAPHTPPPAAEAEIVVTEVTVEEERPGSDLA